MVRVRFFASLREKFGESMDVNVKNVKELLRELKLENVILAVNGELTSENVELKEDDVVDVMPPFSGG